MLKRIVPFAICSVLAMARTAEPQDWHHYVTERGVCQKSEGREVSTDGTVGATFVQDSSCSPSSVIVTSVQSGGPAASAGIEVGDTLFRVVEQGSDIYTVPLIVCELEEEIRKSNGRSISLLRLPRSSSNGSPITLPVKSRAEVDPQEATRASSISEMIEVGMRGPAETKEAKTADGKTTTFQECPPPKRVSISITQVSEHPEAPINVELTVSNQTGALLPLNEGKIFLLDANHRQIQLVTYEERRFQIENTIFEQRKLLHRLDEFTQPGAFSVSPPTPPAPPVRYSIDAVSDGNYQVSPAGMNAINVTGTSTTTLNLKPEFDSSRSLAYLGNTISYWVARRREEKWNSEMQAKWEVLRREVEGDIRDSDQVLENWKRVGFSFGRPLAPSEIRSGFVLFAPSEGNDITSLSLVVVLTDPATERDKFVTFRFRW